MRDVFDIYTIIFLALAVFIFLRLRSVLGQRTGRERPPYDPYSAREPCGRRRRQGRGAAQPRAGSRAAKPVEEPVEPPASAGRASPSRARALAGGLDAIVAADASFDAKHFLTGARAAYEMIVTAYAEGDRRTLQESAGARSL